jgi:hypothetical protein
VSKNEKGYSLFSSELWRAEINGYRRGTHILVSLPTCFYVVFPLSVSCFMYEKKPDSSVKLIWGRWESKDRGEESKGGDGAPPPPFQSRTRRKRKNQQSTNRLHGYGHFLAYIPSWWWIPPILMRVRVHALPPFSLSTITSKVVLYIPAEWADTLLVFLLYPSGRDPPMDEGTLKGQ